MADQTPMQKKQAEMRQHQNAVRFAAVQGARRAAADMRRRDREAKKNS